MDEQFPKMWVQGKQDLSWKDVSLINFACDSLKKKSLVFFYSRKQSNLIKRGQRVFSGPRQLSVHLPTFNWQFIFVEFIRQSTCFNTRFTVYVLEAKFIYAPH